MATIILNLAASNTTSLTGATELTPQDGDIYILQSDAINEFRFLGDADFEVRIEDAGPYAEDSGIFGPVALSFEDTTNPTVTYGNDVDAQRVQLNANGDSLTVNAGDNVTLGPINGSGVQTYSGMPTGDGLNADGGGLTITTGSNTFVTSRIDGPSNGADANYTFGEGGEFGANALVTGSVGGNTTIVVGDNAEVSVNAGFVAPSGELNGNTQSITIGNNAVHDPNYAPAWEVTVAGTYGEKIINLGDNVTVAEVGFGSEGYQWLIDFDNTTTYVNPTSGTLTAGENLTVRTPVWGTEEGSTYILGDGWDVPFDLRGAGANNGDDPEAELILGAPKSDDGTTIEVFGSGNDLISIMPPEAPADERSNLIGSLISEGWSANDDGSYSPTALTDPTNSYLVGPSNDNGDIAIAGFSGAALAPPGPNQIVDGENDAEFMGDGYDDSDGATNSGGDIIDGADGDNDVILGNGGNDTINAGAGTDEVYGGSGNDVIDGGAGNDTLTGDFASDVTDTVVDNSTVEGDDILEGGAGDDVIYGDSGNSLSAGGEGVLGDTLGDGPGSTGGGYARVTAQSVSNGNHTFSTDAFHLGNDIPILDGGDRDALVGVSFSQDGAGTDRSFGLDELTFTGAQRSFVGLVTVQDSDVSGANDQFSSSISGGFQDTTVVSSGTANFIDTAGNVYNGIRVNFVRGPDGETYMVPDDGPSPGAFNAFRNMLAQNEINGTGIASFTIATGSGADTGINPIEGNWADGQVFELIEGDGGDDTIIGGEGADTLFGEGGDDTFIVSSAADGAGDVISGGYGPDESTDNDVLDLTGAGPVTITAAADANDDGAQAGTVTFADGSTLTFEGIETIIQDPAGPTPDGVVDGEETGEVMGVGYDDADGPTDGGGDTITDGPDSIEGNGGDDSITAGDGNDTVDGGADNDTIDGGLGDDSILGGSGNDSLDGGVGTDTLVGGTGDDTLSSDGENDSLVGGDDADTFIGTGFSPTGTGAFTVDGGSGGNDNDTLDLSAYEAEGFFVSDLVQNPETNGNPGFSGAVTLSNPITGDTLVVNYTDIENLILPPNAPDGVVDGEETGEVMGVGYDDADGPTDGGGDTITDGPDSIEGNGGDDSITAGDGNDTVDGGADNDTIDGGLGDDSLDGGIGDDSLLGGDGSDTLNGGDGSDTLAGGEGADVLDGGDGDDDIAVGGLDTASGGTGDDVFTFDATDPAADVNATIDGGSDATDGNAAGTENGDAGDVLDLSDQTVGLDVTFGTDPEAGTVDGLDADGTPDLTFSEIEAVNTGSGADSIDGSAATTGPIDVNAGAGDDTVIGGAGADVLDGGDDDDLITGGAGDDTINGDAGNDTLVGGEGADVLDGGLNDDDIVAGGGDTALGGGGDDVFTVDGTLSDTGPITVIGGETDEEDVIDPTNNPGGQIGDVLDLRGLTNVVVNYTGGDPTSESGTATYENTNGDTVTINFSEIETVIPCFTPGAVIATSKGERLVEDLKPGDRIVTRDNGYKEIAWVGKKDLTGKDLMADPSLKPILVRKGALGRDLPQRDMLVSPNHRLMMSSMRTHVLFDEREVLVAAKHMLGAEGVHQVDVARTSYIHFMFDQHEVVLSDGAWTESFHPGDYSLGGIDGEQRDEILALFPELATTEGRDAYRTARTCLKKHEAKLLLMDQAKVS